MQPTHNSEFVNFVLQVLDPGAVPIPVCLKIVDGSSQHGNLALVVCHLLVEFVDLFTVNLSVLFVVFKSEKKQSRKLLYERECCK